VHTTVGADERWVGVSSGGGGYGNPLDRPVDQVARDVRDGIYGAEHAREVYGVVVESDNAVDDDATAELRRHLRAAQQRDGVPAVLPDRPDAARWRQAR
jgi:N-methylhydantoinase B